MVNENIRRQEREGINGAIELWPKEKKGYNSFVLFYSSTHFFTPPTFMEMTTCILSTAC